MFASSHMEIIVELSNHMANFASVVLLLPKQRLVSQLGNNYQDCINMGDGTMWGCCNNDGSSDDSCN